MTAEKYLKQVLAMLPETLPHRAQIATELRSHIAERLAHGHALDEVLRQLGDPTTLATSYLSAEPLVSASFGSRLAGENHRCAWRIGRRVPDSVDRSAACTNVLPPGYGYCYGRLRRQPPLRCLYIR